MCMYNKYVYLCVYMCLGTYLDKRRLKDKNNYTTFTGVGSNVDWFLCVMAYQP